MSAAAPIVPPVRVERERQIIAPPPMIDRNPLVVGSGLTLAYISNKLRESTDGYREGFVDLLTELRERDAHAFSVLSKRILCVAGGRVEIVAAVTEQDDPDFETAAEIASFVDAQISGIDDLPNVMLRLLWGIYFGLAAEEIEWDRDGAQWKVRALHFIHSRRLYYPLRDTWDLHIAMGGYIPGIVAGMAIRAADYPNKFIIHAPQILGDYVTRDGLGRVLAWWMALKAIGARAAAAYVEGYSRPKPLATYATSADGKPRAATKEDIDLAKDVSAAMGAGSFSSGVLPDSVVIALQRVEGGISHEDWMNFCNGEMTKAIVGQTGTTEIGKNGSRAQAVTMREDQLAINRYDALAIGTSLKKGLARPLTLANYPSFPHLVPKIVVHAVENPDPDRTMARALDGWKIGLPLDANKLGHAVALPIAGEDDPNARRLAPPTRPSDNAGGNAGSANGKPPSGDAADTSTENPDAPND